MTQKPRPAGIAPSADAQGDDRMATSLGITQDGLRAALRIKEDYRKGEPLCVPGERARILLPEYLMNHNLDLRDFDDPLPLAMVAARDPEAPMALAAATRMSPLAPKSPLIGGLFQVMGEATRHDIVRRCVQMITANAFSPDMIAEVRRQASRVIVNTREEFTLALRQNLHALLEGAIAPRQFVREFFDLTEAGNLRNEIRKKLVLSLLLSPNIRPSIKFLLLENFQRMPQTVRLGIIGAVLKAEPSRHLDMIKEELRWIVTQERPETAAAKAI
jgi:hypothetical protein